MTEEAIVDTGYVRAGFLKDLLEQWCATLPHDEWGALVRAMWDLADSAISCSSHAIAQTACDWMKDELSRAIVEEWWEIEDEDRDDAVRKAQAAYEKTVEYWRVRAASFKCSAVFEAELASLPEWFLPTKKDESTAPRLEDDPEYGEYLRLKRRFEK